jgi:putative DNA primase/helicase
VNNNGDATQFSTEERLQSAIEYLKSGLSLVPIGHNSKWPPISWEDYQSCLVFPPTLNGWVNKHPGLGIVGGWVSGTWERAECKAALEILDMESIAPLDKFRKLVEKAAPGLLNRLPRVETPTNGRHIYYRCKNIEGNQKLAERAEEVADAELPRKDDGALDKEAIKKLGLRLIDGKYFKIRTLIETRGEGGQVLSPLCLPGTHPSGGVYKLINGDLRNIPTITIEERDILLNAARACNEFVEPKKAKGNREANREKVGGLKPGADFNLRSDACEKVRALLEEYGWTKFGDSKEGDEWWSRPGVDDHNSATLFDDGTLYVFSTNASPFEARQSYKPFGVFAELKCDGDYSAAAKALAEQGYGEQRDASKKKAAKEESAQSSDADQDADGQIDSDAKNGQEQSEDAGLRKEVKLSTGKLVLELKLNPRAAPTLKASKDAKLLHVDRIALDKDADRKKFVKALSLSDEEGAVVLDALRAWGVENPTPKPKTKAPTAAAFRVDETGVWARGLGEDGDDLLICSMLEITAKTRDAQGGEWGRLLEWTDDDGQRHIWAMPMTMLAGDGSDVRAQLLSGGMTLETKRKARELLNSYLQSHKPEAYARCVPRVGWYGERNYVLPDETLGDETEERIVLQSAVDDYRLTTSGTLEEWREQVSHYAIGNSRLAFAESVGFAAPLLRLLGQEGGGFHLRSLSSKGKSTSQITAGSVYGGGDPQDGYARKWSSTVNALEATAEQHNDGILLLDELAMCDPKEAGNAAYKIASGHGKNRLLSQVKMRKPFKWYLFFISSGEISLADHVAQAGKHVRAGQEVRFVELPADAGCGMGAFEDIHGFESADAFARHLQQMAKRYYGTAIRAYLRELIPNLSAVKNNYKNFEQDCLTKWLPQDKRVSGEVSRVARRFALVAYGGELATDAGITGWAEGEATKAAKRMFTDWLENRGTSGSVDEERAVSQVRAFIEKYGASRFEADSEQDRFIHQRAGFIRDDLGGKEFCIYPEIFRKEVCAGYDPAMVARALHEHGYLVKGDGRNYPANRRPPGGKPIRVYVVRETIFESEQSEQSEQEPEEH